MKIGDRVHCNFGVYNGRIGEVTKMDEGQQYPGAIHIHVSFGLGSFNIEKQGCYAANELTAVQ